MCIRNFEEFLLASSSYLVCSYRFIRFYLICSMFAWREIGLNNLPLIYATLWIVWNFSIFTVRFLIFFFLWRRGVWSKQLSASEHKWLDDEKLLTVCKLWSNHIRKKSLCWNSRHIEHSFSQSLQFFDNIFIILKFNLKLNELIICNKIITRVKTKICFNHFKFN